MKRSILHSTAALLLFGALITSCGNDTGTSASTTEIPDTTATETVADTDDLANFLPEADYGGESFRIIGYSDVYPIDFDKETGAIIDDAIYRRNRTVEEQFNIKIEATHYLFTQYGEVAELFSRAGRAQSDDFDLAALIFRDAYNAVLEGLAPVASDLPIVDLSAGRPWYQNSLNESLTIKGVSLLWYTAFDTYPGGYGLIFNKKLISDLGLDNPYAMVDDGTWTLDAVYEMCMEAVSDLDGNGKYTQVDRFGLITEQDRLTALTYVGTGKLLVEMVDGIPTVSQDARLVDAFIKMQEHINQNGFYLDTFNQFGWAESSRDIGVDLFKAGNSLFYIGGTTLLTRFGDMVDDYGILPFPKWDEAQNRYYSSSNSDSISTPLSCSEDLERVCIIKEALAIESLNEVYPTYFENALKNRYIRDEESQRMLTLMMETVVHDFGQAPFWDIIRTPWADTLMSGKPNFVSAVEKSMNKSQKALDEMMDMVNAVLGN